MSNSYLNSESHKRYPHLLYLGAPLLLVTAASYALRRPTQLTKSQHLARQASLQAGNLQFGGSAGNYSPSWEAAAMAMRPQQASGRTGTFEKDPKVGAMFFAFGYFLTYVGDNMYKSYKEKKALHTQ